MDHLTRWIDRSASFRISSLDGSESCRILAIVHDLDGEGARGIAQAVSGALLLASDLKSGQTISLQMEVGNRIYHADATADGLVRAKVSERGDDSSTGLAKVRRLGEGGVLYQSVAEAHASTVQEMLQAFLDQSEQQPTWLDLPVELDAQGLPIRVRGAWLRGFPATPRKALAELAASWKRRCGPWDASSPGTGLCVEGWDALERHEIVVFCPCSRERALRALVALGAEGALEAKAKGEPLEVVCDFCRSAYSFDPNEVLSVI
ncbi:MAG TPA: Hsp33 family molecular chaperone HslO [Fibrobacteria bacterium]|nr:Hsp33 family molecular chaperone HslO [Fibrobacteria bacterium]